MDEREGLEMVRRSWKSLLASMALVGGIAVGNTAFAGGKAALQDAVTVRIANRFLQTRARS
jgi:hypothetical protein